MARDFTKNVANYLSGLGNGGIGSLLEGASALSCHTWIQLDSISGSSNDNRVFRAIINAGDTGFSLMLNSATGARVKILVQPTATDTARTRTGNSQVIATDGSWAPIGGVVNFAGDNITPYCNGVADNGGQALFTSTAWALGTPTSPDTVGTGDEAPASTASQINGRLADLAIWTTALSAQDFSALAKGFSPALIRPQDLVFYMPLIGGDASLEMDVVSGKIATINGAIPKADHPRVIYSRRKRYFSFDVATTAAELVGAASAQATVAGALTTQIPLLGAAILVATATGALSTEIPLSASPGSEAGSAGALDTGIAMGVAPSGEASAVGSIDTGIPISGVSASVTTGAGMLTAQIKLSGAALLEALAQAGLDAGILLAGAASGQAVLAGDLSTQIPFSGSAGAISVADANLTAQIALSGDALSQALAQAGFAGSGAALAGALAAEASSTAQLITGIPLSGSPQAFMTASGGLTTIIGLSGVSASFSSLTGGLITEIKLSAQALAEALQTGLLGTGIALGAESLAEALAQASLTAKIQLAAAPLAEALAAGALAGESAAYRLSASRKLIIRAKDRRLSLASMPGKFVIRASRKLAIRA